MITIIATLEECGEAMGKRKSSGELRTVDQMRNDALLMIQKAQYDLELTMQDLTKYQAAENNMAYTIDCAKKASVPQDAIDDMSNIFHIVETRVIQSKDRIAMLTQDINDLKSSLAKLGAGDRRALMDQMNRTAVLVSHEINTAADDERSRTVRALSHVSNEYEALTQDRGRL